MCHSRPASLLIVLSFLLSISACGGGGGGGGSDGSASYTIGGTVTGAVNSGLALENNGGDTLEVGGVDFEFATKLADGSSYDVTLATLPEHQLCSMENASGTVVGADVNDVSVLCRSWRSAALIETGTGEAASPQIAFNNDGNAIAVWVQFDGTQDNIWASIYSPGGGWSAAVVIGDENGDARAPQIAIDDDGNAIVVWTQQSTYYNAWIRRYSPDSGWSSEGLIEFNGGDASDPQIAMNNAGNAIIVWVQNEAPPTSPNPLNLWANTYTPGVGSGTAELVEADAGSAQDPQVAFDSAGNAIAVWEQYNGSTWYDIRASVWAPGSGWAMPEDIETIDDGNSFDPQIVIDGDNNATVVWTSSDGTRFNIWANNWSQAAGWGSEELIETDNAGDAFDPQIAVDSMGNVIAVWRQRLSVGTGYSTVANTYSPNDGWSSAALIEDPSNGSAGNQQIAFDNEGNAIAVWRNSNIWANTWSPISGWDAATLIENDNAGIAVEPQIAFDGASNAIAVWAESDGTRDNIRANQFE
ncbi:hypothetical protein SAMN04487868_10130 [Marinobacter salarius]|jgi:hypothetical protein|uniref:Uncharacterized protein n=2 Tax=Marinobacter salarius TaxID=1420917 RepID=A0ABY1FGY5_9GAMM|nr:MULTISPECIES: hypothetical protein [Marinobacter]KXJ48449.1 MAG: hypothetical protein AXW11_01380 [Marinobacter sp. Hex_13]MBL84978.1 hypothetical protein [Marinobacter sp.]SFL36582.1 hypothetical protein SAMN04487868_10130 [Marinobacter salarius]|tara:strand:- start:8230 stop:9810 length:1581 start_codon:yes stop_codon:yes gene_type:complete